MLQAREVGALALVCNLRGHPRPAPDDGRDGGRRLGPDGVDQGSSDGLAVVVAGLEIGPRDGAVVDEGQRNVSDLPGRDGVEKRRSRAHSVVVAVQDDAERVRLLGTRATPTAVVDVRVSLGLP